MWSNNTPISTTSMELQIKLMKIVDILTQYKKEDDAQDLTQVDSIQGGYVSYDARCTVNDPSLMDVLGQFLEKHLMKKSGNF
jgi:putative lipoic acid-binding regulatory protein